MGGTDGAPSRVRGWQRNGELELEPLATRDAIGLIAIFVSLCVVSCGGVMFYGSDWTRHYDAIGWTGLALALGGATAFFVVMWLLEPHKAARHASHRLRHHARKLRTRGTQNGPAEMTDAQFNALEDQVDRLSADSPSGSRSSSS